ncbi:glutathione S-transferase T3-like protein [Tanacetum coccineum]|uniref:Glutathione S-transferase T3-like protein n=1 Tax=Tanacetum coccineum TaxID=301880 RepID=A0ABQ5DJ84_9ASTR
MNTNAKSNLSSTTSITAAKAKSFSDPGFFNLDDDNFEPLWASASQPFQPYSEGPSQPVENDSLVEEVEPVQPKRKYTRRSKPTKKNDKEFVEPWTIEEEIALCKAFVAKSEDSVEGNGKKAAGFWREVAEHFHEEMGEDKRSYDSVNCKWKNRIRPKVSQFCEIYNSVRDRHKVSDPSLVDALLSKFTMAATPFFTQRKESPSEYLRIKERELELEERKRQEQGELERMRIAQREKELDLQKMFEFQQQQKFEVDLKN